ncbi:hypothetical protein EYF80_003254 [Liparis tanakae]|uniref:Uncharacterized protein n=1 Tax=Liparis tanakae TaxID=230148 RepID=A0A4Z2J9L3_9TELE|nr:hypothetical protein EYF80_003254 [Liparis tanakae]
MSKLSSQINPQILLNDEKPEQRRDATTEGPTPDVAVEDGCLEDGDAAEKKTQAKVQSVFQQVRDQIRSQVVLKGPQSSLMELVQRVRETEIAKVNGEPEGEDVSSKEKPPGEMLTDVSTDGMDLKEEELCALFEKKLEASEKAIKDEFEGKISQVRKEMQAYTDQSWKDLECKMQESKGPNKIQKTSAAPSLAPRRGRVLTRTMTTTFPKTCAPVIMGPRAKSETLSSSKGASSRLLLRDPALVLPVYKPCQSRKPLPPVCPPLHQHNKVTRPKAKTANGLNVGGKDEK